MGWAVFHGFSVLVVVERSALPHFLLVSLDLVTAFAVVLSLLAR